MFPPNVVILAATASFFGAKNPFHKARAHERIKDASRKESMSALRRTRQVRMDMAVPPEETRDGERV